ncbi:sensor domain-containing diguanylate cyclase [Vibrio agarivorans]|uniref:diguanylate cyclase n=1 Tax=Vibrio agarivorans TaxID=153622 RepID=A0ABT7Y4S2_9VIBR|nr:sensor domain-containing diguanylate cyclase [Vibrio agarivorans]MDN2483037.1 sensor domain-containing diguanylate cyclase [Vibrio agarivorans]
MTTLSQAKTKMIGLLTQLQKYPDIQGLVKIKSVLNTLADDYDETIPQSINHFIVGLTHDRHDELELAVQNYEHCINSCDESELTLSLLSKILIGSICSEQDNYQRSYLMFDEVLSYSHLLDGYPLSLAYTNISGLYCNMKLYHEAIDVGHKGIANSKTINNPYNQAICLLNVGYAYAHLKEVQLSILYLTKAVNLAISIDNPRVEAIAHTYLTHAKVLDKQHYPHTEIIEHFETAERLYKSVKVNFNRIENGLYWAKYLESIDQNDQATRVLSMVKPKLQNNDYGEFQRLFLDVEQKLLNKSQQPEALIACQRRAINQLSKDLDIALTQQSHTISDAVKITRQEQVQLVDSKVYENLGTINAIGQYVATSKNLDECLPQIYQQVAQIFPATEFGIAIYDEQRHQLQYRYFYDEKGPVKSVSVNTQTERSLGVYCIEHRQTVHLNLVSEEAISPYLGLAHSNASTSTKHDTSDTNKSGIDNCDLNSVIITPITLGDRVLGILSVQHRLANQYQQHHCRLFEQLASFIAIALDNRQQRQELELANKTLDKLSKTDPLTGLYNRYSLDSITPQVINRAINQHLSLSMVIIDIDYYKSYNDHYGHQKGDEALREVSQALLKTFNCPNDYLFRYGGDEFLLLSLSYSVSELELRLNELYQAIATLKIENPSSPVDNYLTLSCGGAYVDGNSSNIHYDKLFNLADGALYKVKAKDRNGFSIDFHTTDSF